MNTTYNKHYQQEDYFGQPYPGLVKFFKDYPSRPTVLDLGCGQGRDALFLGRLGYKVLGIDIAEVGIEQMNQVAKAENLPVVGRVADLYYYYSIEEEYKIILLDSIFHFYKNDILKESKLLKRILTEMPKGGLLCNFMLKGDKREAHLKKIVKDHIESFKVEADQYTDYPEYDAQFHVYILRKTL
ncbi:methyltransferase domain-containing protein [Facklamia sp. 7083-14-GEN3]|uniref:methyltransferase domain-containing protein n=1 Tax=Facklamia sp. 7083-14-GEN3 TaxID=2973478 RepID=UPI00215BDF24|nr:methyltransferase domain-containing protein [Facklamia sp. 7083-14-GEN3]MCR8968406.1 methyltransferase domain-containing protein [Facklamia sp. 7083-14-GEN3]